MFLVEYISNSNTEATGVWLSPLGSRAVESALNWQTPAPTPEFQKKTQTSTTQLWLRNPYKACKLADSKPNSISDI